MLTYPNEKTIVLIDGPNLHGAMKQLGWDIDYALLKKYFASKCQLLRLNYYTAVGENMDGLRGMLDYLDYHGFTVMTKPVKTMNSYDDEKRSMKGNMDVDITVDAMKIAPHVDHIVLFTGDGDFVPLVEYLQDIGKRVTIACTALVKVMADDLRRVGDNFLELDELKTTCARDPKTRVKAGLERNHA